MSAFTHPSVPRTCLEQTIHAAVVLDFFLSNIFALFRPLRIKLEDYESYQVEKR